jgi:hypothetical protein
MGLLDIRFNNANDAKAYADATAEHKAADGKFGKAYDTFVGTAEGNGKSRADYAGISTGDPTPKSLSDAVAAAKTKLDEAEKKGGWSLLGTGLLWGIITGLAGGIVTLIVPGLFPFSWLVIPFAGVLVAGGIAAGAQYYRFPAVAPAETKEKETPKTAFMPAYA